MKLLPKFGWRITKYNPAFRNENGAYLKDEWTSISDVGESFDSKILTKEEYQEVEDAYVSTALHFVSKSGIEFLQVSYVEKRNLQKVEKKLFEDISYNPRSIRKNLLVSGKNSEDVCRLILREIIWCRLESEGKFYIHFGYDYYLYIGSNIWSKEAIEYAEKNGLFIEEMMSPYIDQE